MSFTYSVSTSLGAASGTVAQTKNYQYDSIVESSPASGIPAGATDHVLSVSFQLAQVKVFYIDCDRDITVKINDAAGAGGQLALKGQNPYDWNEDKTGYYTLFITANVTQILFTNPDATNPALYNLRVLLDAIT